jgi:hypothetical protein
MNRTVPSWFQVLTATSMKMTVFWDVAPCSLVWVISASAGHGSPSSTPSKDVGSSATHRPDDGGSKHLKHVGKLLPDYTAKHPRRQPSSELYLTPFLQRVKQHECNSSLRSVWICNLVSRVKERTDWGCLITGCWGEYFDLRGMKWQEAGEKSIMRSCIDCTPHQIACYHGDHTEDTMTGVLSHILWHTLTHWPMKGKNLTFLHSPDDGGSKNLWNVGKLIPNYTGKTTRRQPSSYSTSWELQILPSTCTLLGQIKH